MIELKKLNGGVLFVNPTHIMKIECTPDTLIVFVTGEKQVVADTITEVVSKISEHHRFVIRKNQLLALET